MSPLRGLFLLDPRFYKDAVPTELKRALKSSGFPRSIRFGWNAGLKCKAKTNFAACGQNLGEYTAKPNLPGLELRRLFFLKLTPMVHRKTEPTGPGESKLDEKIEN